MTKQTENKADKSDNQAQTTNGQNLQRKKKEIGGPKGPEPTRYGDWEKKGRCIDF